MSIKKVEQVKTDKGFKILDLFVYGTIVAIVVALFLTFFFINKDKSSDGVQILYKNTVIFEYAFADDMSTIYDDRIIIIDNNTSTLKVKYTTSDGSGYNVIKIDKSNQKVSVIDANCSSRKDCVYSADFLFYNGGIICVPHSLTIQPLSTRYSDDDIILI